MQLTRPSCLFNPNAKSQQSSVTRCFVRPVHIQGAFRYSGGMAAKNKSPPDVQEIFGLHVEGSKQRDQLLEQVRALQSAGKIREARKRLKAADQIQQCLHALETECRHPNKTRDKRFGKD